LKETVVLLNYMDVLNPLSGGAERYLHEMAKRLASDGYRVVFISARFPGSERGKILGLNLPELVYTWPMFRKEGKILGLHHKEDR